MTLLEFLENEFSSESAPALAKIIGCLDDFVKLPIPENPQSRVKIISCVQQALSTDTRREFSFSEMAKLYRTVGSILEDPSLVPDRFFHGRLSPETFPILATSNMDPEDQKQLLDAVRSFLPDEHAPDMVMVGQAGLFALELFLLLKSRPNLPPSKLYLVDIAPGYPEFWQSIQEAVIRLNGRTGLSLK